MPAGRRWSLLVAVSILAFAGMSTAEWMDEHAPAGRAASDSASSVRSGPAMEGVLGAAPRPGVPARLAKTRALDDRLPLVAAAVPASALVPLPGCQSRPCRADLSAPRAAAGSRPASPRAPPGRRLVTA